MVSRNVPKLHGLFGIGTLAAVIAIPIGCGDDKFTGCEASRTCPPSGKGGEGGAGTGSGGTSGSSGTSSGRSGAGGDDGGAGTGGAGDDERPTVESFTPTTGSTEIERDIIVTAELSEPIDEATVTRTSVTLEGPEGTVAGTLSVDDNVISFEPDRPLYLLGNYTFTLGETVADLDGNTLEESASAEFQVRDGRWGAIETPFGRTPRPMDGFTQNVSGDVLLAGVDQIGATLWAAVYTATSQSWSPIATLDVVQYARLPSNSAGMGMDSEGRMALAWNGPTTGGWFRSTEQEGWQDVGTLPWSSVLAVARDGIATAAWVRDGMLSVQTLNIASGMLGSITPLWPTQLATLTDLQAVASLNRTALFVRTAQGAGDEISVAWGDAESVWGSPEPLASAADISPVWTARADEDGNVVLIWIEGAQVWSRIFERDTGTWTRSILIATGAPAASFGEPQMSHGAIGMPLYLEANTAHGAYYQRGVGWVQNSIVDLASLGVGDFTSGFGIQMSIDGRGNVLALGHTHYQRYFPRAGWQPAVPHELDLGPWRMWMATAPDGSTLAITHDLTANDEFIPRVVSFE